jgi:type I restriction enzyme S subunit
MASARMKKIGWPMVALGELLRRVKRRELVEPSKTYDILGAHWYAKGLYTKHSKPGSQIRARYVYRVEQGDFVYNRLFAWKGSFAIATQENDGCHVSNEFPCFVANRERLDGQYLWYYFSRASAWNEALGLSSGGTPTSRNRLKEAKLLAMHIPLPPPEEQRRIVARIEELATKVEAARALRQQAATQIDRLYISASRQAFTERNNWQFLSVEECCEAIIDYRGRTPPTSQEGIPHLTSANVRSGNIDWTTTRFVTEETYNAYMTRGIPRAGDVLFTMEAPLGNAAVVPDDRRFSLAQRLILLRGASHIVSGDFLAQVLMSPSIREEIYSKATGTTVKGIAAKRLKPIKLPIPPSSEQHRIVVYLDALQTKVDAVKQYQAATAAALDALLPSILDRAFKGEL